MDRVVRKRVMLVIILAVQQCQAKSGDEVDSLDSTQATENNPDKPNKHETNQNSISNEELEIKNDDSDIKTLTEEEIEGRPMEEGEMNVGGEEFVFPVAKTNLGMLLGRIEQSRDGNRILAFRGIRHLQPPVGELRFEPPVAAASWEGIVEAKTNGEVCPQHLATRPDIWVGSEDCLWLNVFTRDLVSKRGRPVIVWIHGGSFSRGSAAEYDPDYLLDQDIVLVTVQYRLGMLGFLSTETAAAPGNYGMLDQVAALRWVRQNIAAFSGDPDMVTIMGQQAGGASVHYHMLSPITRGLFNRAVSLSGTALCWWASIKGSQEKAQKLAHMVDCPNDGDMEKLIDCIKEKPVVDLMNTVPHFYQWKHLQQTQEPLTVWSPRADPEASVEAGHLSFMPEEPIDIIKAGKFQHSSWITGVTEDEGATRASAFFNDKEGVAEFESLYEVYAPLLFGLHDGQSEDPSAMAERVKDHYFGDKISEPALVDAISDSSYAYPAATAAKLHAENGANVFLYHFGYRGEHSMSHIVPDEYPPRLQPNPTAYGVGNGDDLIYLFPVNLLQPQSPEDIKFSNQLVELITTFVKTGKPSIEQDDAESPLVWSPVNTTSGSQVFSQLNIGNVIRMDKGLPNHERMSFWESMPVYWKSRKLSQKSASFMDSREEL